MGPLVERARAFAGELVELRRDLHRHPELAFRETRTAAAAAEHAERLGFRVRRGVGRTGVVAELGGGGPVVALRADMDALPIQEAGDVEYRSTVAGVMHACGHDAHVAMLVGAARLLAEHEALPTGTVRLLFQPSEEGADEENKSGATRMVEDGAMEGVEAVFGLHIGAHLPAGTIHMRPGSFMAGTDGIRASVTGRSAHAARPEEGVDAVVLAAHFVLACQNAVARRIAPTQAGVVTLGRVQGGTAENIIAERVSIEGTLRYFEEPVRRRLHEALRAAAGVVEAMGGGADVTIRPGYPPVVNDERMNALARRAVADTLGEDRIVSWDPWMGAEDFAILQREAPGCFFWLGAALDPPREHHHPRFDIDESALPLGASALASCAITALRELGR